MALLYFIAGCYGFTMLVVQSKIMEPFREFFKGRVNFMYKLLNCMMCTGFWVGLFFTLGFKFSPSYEMFSDTHTNVVKLISYTIFDASFMSGVIWLIYLLQLNLERHVEDKL
jgi:Na+/H+-dicarboxylate symporter